MKLHQRNIHTAPTSWKLIVLATTLCFNSYGQDLSDKTKNMRSPFIFDSNNLEQNTQDLSSIYTGMAKYYEAVEKANVVLLDEVFHDQWFMRDTDTPDEASLNVEGKQTFIKRVQDHGPYPGYASERAFATVSMANDDLAFVRINKAPSRSSTSFFFFKISESWKIVDKLWVNVTDESSEIRRSETYVVVERLLHDYFAALKASDAQVLDKLLHEHWDLKHMADNGQLQSVSKQQYLKATESNGDHIDYSQLLSIDVYHGKMAIARIDIPSETATSFLIFFKVGDQWQIVSERRSGIGISTDRI